MTSNIPKDIPSVPKTKVVLHLLEKSAPAFLIGRLDRAQNSSYGLVEYGLESFLGERGAFQVFRSADLLGHTETLKNVNKYKVIYAWQWTTTLTMCEIIRGNAILCDGSVMPRDNNPFPVVVLCLTSLLWPKKLPPSSLIGAMGSHFFFFL